LAHPDPVNKEQITGHFAYMIDHCLDYAQAQKAAGRTIVGIMCEFTPRELIMAAGAVPVCLCGGSAKTIAAAEEHLPSNLCPLIKSTYGYLVTHKNPFLEMAELVVGETTCDGKKKMFELMGERKPVYLLELPQKSDNQDSFRRWLDELHKFKKALEDTFGVVITNDAIRTAVREMNRERSFRRSLAQLMKSENPPLTGCELLDMKSSVSCIPQDLAMYERALSLASSSPTAESTNHVRVLFTGVPTVYGAEKVMEIIEQRGGVVVAQENCTGLKPIWDDVDESGSDVMVALARKYYNTGCSVMTPNNRRFEVLRTIADDYRPQCIVELIWQGCLTYDVESYRVRQLADELGLPYLRIESDYGDSDRERIATRVEALFETVARPGKI
jgi:benzoyl-CoA reductase/2-hydroxyglutaryl-CoA dehydratase subunit BcrC/BadD/HgdB